MAKSGFDFKLQMDKRNKMKIIKKTTVKQKKVNLPCVSTGTRRTHTRSMLFSIKKKSRTRPAMANERKTVTQKRVYHQGRFIFSAVVWSWSEHYWQPTHSPAFTLCAFLCVCHTHTRTISISSISNTVTSSSPTSSTLPHIKLSAELLKCLPLSLFHWVFESVLPPVGRVENY